MKRSDGVILVIDDDRTTCRILTAMLQRLGFKTVAGECCAEARELFEVEAPALIFLDIELGDDDGTDFCAWVRSQENGKEIPIIMGSSHNEREYVERSIKAGANDFLVKPYHPLSVKERLEKYLGE